MSANERQRQAGYLKTAEPVSSSLLLQHRASPRVWLRVRIVNLITTTSANICVVDTVKKQSCLQPISDNCARNTCPDKLASINSPVMFSSMSCSHSSRRQNGNDGEEVLELNKRTLSDMSPNLTGALWGVTTRSVAMTWWEERNPN